jgi:hypothetical protein
VVVVKRAKLAKWWEEWRRELAMLLSHSGIWRHDIGNFQCRHATCEQYSPTISVVVRKGWAVAE